MPDESADRNEITMPDDAMNEVSAPENWPDEEPDNGVDTVEAGDGSVEPIVRDPTAQYALDDTPWLTSIWRPTLITIASGCLVVAFLAFAQRIVPELPTSFARVATALGLVGAIVGCTSTTFLAQPGRRSDRQAGYRAAELIFLIVITRISVWLVMGEWPGIELLLHPVTSLFDGYFIIALVGVFMAWIMATSMTDDMINMGLRPDDIYMSRGFNDKWQDTARPVYTDRPAILRRFTGRWVFGGLLIVIFAAGSRFAMPEPGFYLPVIQQGIDPTVIISAIIYFMVGLALISQGQLALLRARWALQKTPSSPSILRRWPVYAFGLIVIVGIISAMLPLGGTFHLAMIINAIINGAFWLIVHIFGFFLAFFSLFLMLFQRDEQELPPTPTPKPLPQVTIEPSPAQPPAEIPPWAGGTVFWIIAALVIGYAAYIYFGGRGFSFAWLRKLWEMLHLRWGQMVVSLSDWQATRTKDDDAKSTSGGRRRRSRLLTWLGYRGLDPDSQVRYYYLSMLEQAEEAGRPRRRFETPYRYAKRLDAALLARAQETSDDTPADETDAQPADVQLPDDETSRSSVYEYDGNVIQSLTEAFVGVRYAQRRIDASEASVLRKVWEKTKRLLKQ